MGGARPPGAEEGAGESCILFPRPLSRQAGIRNRSTTPRQTHHTGGHVKPTEATLVSAHTMAFSPQTGLLTSREGTALGTRRSWSQPGQLPGGGCMTPLFLSERGGWPIRRGRWAPRPAGGTCSGWPTAGCRRRGAADRAETGTQALARASADARHRDGKVPSNPVLVRGGEMRPEPPTPRGAPPPELL